MKTCIKCNIEKELEEFAKRSDTKDGRRNECIVCNKQRLKQWHIDNKDEVTKKKKLHYLSKREYNIERSKKRQQDNRDKYLNDLREWRKNNPNYKKEYYAKNKEKIKNHIKDKKYKRMLIDPVYYLRHRIRHTIKTALHSKNYSKKSKTAKLLGCSYEDFLAYLGPKPDGDVHLDHICPCAQAQNEEEIIKLQHYTNFRWLSAQENLLKGHHKTPEAEAKCKELLNRDWI